MGLAVASVLLPWRRLTRQRDQGVGGRLLRQGWLLLLQLRPWLLGGSLHLLLLDAAFKTGASIDAKTKDRQWRDTANSADRRKHKTKVARTIIIITFFLC
jgi:hypothetical protein